MKFCPKTNIYSIDAQLEILSWGGGIYPGLGEVGDGYW